MSNADDGKVGHDSKAAAQGCRRPCGADAATRQAIGTYKAVGAIAARAPLGAMSSAALPLMNLFGTRPGAKRGGQQRKKIEQ
jgi:hypothetical protein